MSESVSVSVSQSVQWLYWLQLPVPVTNTETDKQTSDQSLLEEKSDIRTHKFSVVTVYNFHILFDAI